MSVEERLLKVIEISGLSKKDFAESIGVSNSNISNWINPEYTSKPSFDALLRISEKHFINVNWLLSGIGEVFLDQVKDQKPKVEINADRLKHYIELGKSNTHPEDSIPINKGWDNSNNNTVVSLPIVGEIAAGNPLEVRDVDVLGKILVSSELISDPNNFYCFRVNGWSMSPEIQHNDVVILNKVYDYDDMDNRIVAVRLDDGITLKLLKLDHENECSWLMPINDDYKPILINQYSSIVMLGVLEFLIRSYK
jgi:SOS-response transcriptional repressor LexA